MDNIGFFLTESDQNWNGGINYFNNLFKILLDSGKFNPIVFTSKKSRPVLEVKLVKGVKIVEKNFLTSGSLSYYIWKIGLYYLKRSFFVDALLKHYDIALVSHSTRIPLNLRSKVKSCPWIPDLQFLHYPEYFNDITRKRLNYIFKYLGATATKLLFSSEDSRNDYLKMDPKIDEEKLRVFHFVVKPTFNTIDETSDIELKYKVKKNKYFIVTNQFWRHKNHLLVLDAINELKKKRKILPYKFVFTGLLNDPRDPSVASDISKRLIEYNITQDIIMTGVIPYDDVLVLQKYSISVIQPSLFEGWNTAVEECKNIGKKIILSNIPVHVEQNPDNVIFFDSQDCKSLADAIEKVYKSFDFDTEKEYYDKAVAKQSENWKEFSNDYLKILDELLYM